MIAAYHTATRAIRLVAPLLSRGDSKLARGLRGRRDPQGELARWSRSVRDTDRPLVWLHAPSVGECFQAEAVGDALVAICPGLQRVLTHFSPSVEPFIGRLAADVVAYLPWDLPEPLSTALDALRPDAVVFTKTEIWPGLVSEAARRGIPLGIVAASVPAGAGRLKWPARSLLRSSWAALDLAGALSEDDAVGLERLGVRPEVITVTGDPGVDSAARRLHVDADEPPWLASLLEPSVPTVVAGSTWPADEAALLPALSTARRALGPLRVVVAPHEPRADGVAGLTRNLSEAGWKVASLAEVESTGRLGDVDAVVVDRVGLLARLYRGASVAFVGGGFGGGHLHSVLEPAAAAVPVVFGPSPRRAFSATELLASGGAKLAANPTELGRVLVEWLGDAGTRRATGALAAGYIERHRGAADRTAGLLGKLVNPTR